MLELPTVPALVLTIVGLFAPYVIALINQPSWTAGTKRLISIAGSLALGLISLALYYAISGEPIPEWPVLLILVVLVSQTSYALITKPSATKVEQMTSKE